MNHVPQLYLLELSFPFYSIYDNLRFLTSKMVSKIVQKRLKLIFYELGTCDQRRIQNPVKLLLQN